MKFAIRSLMMAAVTCIMATGIAAAQCAPAAGCKPKAAGCSPQAKSGCSPKAAMKAGPAKHKTLVGVVSDTACGAKHTMMPGSSDAACTRACVSKGSKYALVVGKKVYTLEGRYEELDKLAGEKAKVTGMVSGDVVQVSTVAPAKKSKKS
jgi:hypothetical protein